MEKTTHITIASMEFSLVESAYERLKAYLASLAAHFEGEAERAEIMVDIESRIAEKLLAKKRRVITLEDVEAVIAEIGDASQFDDGTAPEQEAPPRARRKLYRDPDDTILAGVASGIAAYFGIDPIVVRLIFIASLFLGGTGILIYLLLALLIPKAESASQKLEMRGDPVTVDAITRLVKKGAEESRRGGVFQGAARSLSSAIQFLGQLLGPLAKLFGAVIAAGAFFGVIALTVAAGIVLVNWGAPFNDFPLRPVMPPLMLSFTTLATYLAIALPLVLVFALGYRLVRRQNLFSGAIGLGIIGLWALAIVSCGVLWAKVAADYASYVRNDPAREVIEREISIPVRSEISIENAQVTLREGAPSVVVRGQQAYLDEVAATTSGQRLVLAYHPRPEAECFFSCGHSSPSIIVTLPDVEAVTLDGGRVFFDDLSTDALSIDAKGGDVRGSMAADNFDIALDGAYMDASLSADTITASLKNASTLSLRGSAKSAEIEALASRMYSDGFMLESAAIHALDSYVAVSAATSTIEQDARSTIRNFGAVIEH